jgi:hypothetical protein
MRWLDPTGMRQTEDVALSTAAQIEAAIRRVAASADRGRAGYRAAP